MHLNMSESYHTLKQHICSPVYSPKASKTILPNVYILLPICRCVIIQQTYMLAMSRVVYFESDLEINEAPVILKDSHRL